MHRKVLDPFDFVLAPPGRWARLRTHAKASRRCEAGSDEGLRPVVRGFARVALGTARPLAGRAVWRRRRRLLRWPRPLVWKARAGPRAFGLPTKSVASSLRGSGGAARF